MVFDIPIPKPTTLTLTIEKTRFPGLILRLITGYLLVGFMTDSLSLINSHPKFYNIYLIRYYYISQHFFVSHEVHMVYRVVSTDPNVLLLSLKYQ